MSSSTFISATVFNFGDIVVDHWASEGNPLRVAIYVGVEGQIPQFSDGVSMIWPGAHLRATGLAYQIVGNVIDGDTLVKARKDYAAPDASIMSQAHERMRGYSLQGLG